MTSAGLGGRQQDVCEIIRAFMEGPKTIEELREVVNLRENAIAGWVRALRRSGVVRISDRLPGKCYVFSMQPTPFAEEDVPLRDRPRQRRRAAPKAVE